MTVRTDSAKARALVREHRGVTLTYTHAGGTIADVAASFADAKGIERRTPDGPFFVARAVLHVASSDLSTATLRAGRDTVTISGATWRVMALTPNPATGSTRLEVEAYTGWDAT